jgi:hypothetical protein
MYIYLYISKESDEKRVLIESVPPNYAPRKKIEGFSIVTLFFLCLTNDGMEALFRAVSANQTPYLNLASKQKFGSSKQHSDH